MIRLLLAGTVAVAAWQGWPADRAAAQTADADGAKPAAGSEEDPFADELNPFGSGKAVKPPVSPPPAAVPRGQREPEPDSETPRPALRPKPRPKLPVPFPDAPPDVDEPGRADRSRGRFERQPAGPPALPGRASGDAWLEQSPAEKMLVEADELEKAGKLDEARDLLRKVVAEDPSSVVGHLALGVVLRRMGDFRGSVEACTKGIEIDPQEPELYLRRGIAWFHQGLYGIALEDFEEAAGIAYEDSRPELWRGLTLVELDRPLEAINAYASAIRRDRGCMMAYLNRGLTYLATNEPAKAEFDFNQAIRHRPRDARLWFNRGVAQARQGRFGEAIVSYETALDIAPNDAAARRNLEAARRMAGRSTTPSGR